MEECSILKPYFKTNEAVLYQCDNLELLKELPTNYIDLVYVDPPFSTGKIFKTKSGEFAFGDKFTLEELIYYLAVRIQQIHRILKNTGTFYIHGDSRFMPYIRIECDKIFGINNFRNEIIWCYYGASNDTNNFLKKHDNILRYSKSNEYVFNSNDIRVPYNEETLARYKRGKPGRGNKTELNIFGKIPEDWWEFSVIKNQPEKTGYPTQKPTKLLERIIKASSNNGDIVADFFMGSGSTGDVALSQNRKFIGCDVGKLACDITKERLKKLNNIKE